MNSDAIKLVAPVIFALLWANFALKNPKVLLIGAALFFTSIVAFSQNFLIFYRELHQLIQVVLIGVGFLHFAKIKKIHKVNYFFGFFLILVVNAAVFSEFDNDARAQLINLVVVIGITNYLYISIFSADRLNLIIKFVGQLALFSAIFGILEFFLFASSRIEGTFANSNYYAFFLGIGYCACFEDQSKTKRIGSLAIIVAAILLSGSRAALCFPLAHVLWHLYRRQNAKSLISYSIAALLCLVIVGLLGAGRFTDREASEGSDAERIIFAMVAYRMANDHPLVGVGWGRYISEFANYSSNAEQILTSSGEVDVSEQERRVTHNDYLRVLAELGWIAFIIIVVFVLFGMRKLLSKKFVGPLYIFPIWFGSVAFSLTHNNLNSALFWFIVFMPYFYLEKVLDQESLATLET